MATRRVVLDGDDDRPAFVSRGPDASGEVCADSEAREAEQAEIDARELSMEEVEDGDGPSRERDLAPAAPDPFKARANTPRRSGAPDDAGSDRAELEAVLGRGDAASIAPFREDLSAEPGTRWLREHDPLRTLGGMEDAIDAALAARGLALTEVRRLAFVPGKPSDARRALRATARQALLAMYEDGSRRVLMAQALGCSRPALHGLMHGPG